MRISAICLAAVLLAGCNRQEAPMLTVIDDLCGDASREYTLRQYPFVWAWSLTVTCNKEATE